MKRVLILLILVGSFVCLAGQEESIEAEPATERPDESQLTFDFNSEAQADDAAPQGVASLGFGAFLRMFLVLGLIIGLIYLFFWFMKKLSGQQTANQDIVNLLATQSLKGEQTLYLVEVGTEVLLLGGGSQNLSLIKKIEDQETLDDLRLRASRRAAGQKNSFFQALKEQVFPNKAKVNPNSAETQEPIRSDSMERQTRRLRDL